MSYTLIKNIILFSFKNIKDHFFSWLSLACIMLLATVVTGLISLFLYGIIPNIYKQFNCSGLFDRNLSIISYGILGIIALFICYLIYLVLAKTISFWFLQTRNSLDLAQKKSMSMLQERFQNFELLHGFILYRLIAITLPVICIKLSPFLFKLFSLYLWYKLILYTLILLILCIFMMILYVRCYLYKFVLLDEKCSAIEALSKSWNISKGHFWELFLITCTDFYVPIFFLINFIIPIQDLPAAYLYVHYKNKFD